MKIDRRTFIKKMNWALASAIGMLGFAGCEKESGANYTVRGTVVNKATRKPITGIQVGYDSGYQIGLMYGPPMPPYTPKASVITNVNGEFMLTDHFRDEQILMVDNKRILPVYVQDIDGIGNGLYQSECLQADFPKGQHIATINVELIEIED